ncbi:unnamed protein product, partial [marine sediment metagenome]
PIFEKDNIYCKLQSPEFISVAVGVIVFVFAACCIIFRLKARPNKSNKKFSLSREISITDELDEHSHVEFFEDDLVNYQQFEDYYEEKKGDGKQLTN